jgi:beta-phosphoglucomutase-like phosphatase (HAD superfamily)
MTKKTGKLILLDFDGTIVDSTNAWTSIYQEYCKQNNFVFSESINNNKLPFIEWIEVIKQKHIILGTTQSIIASLNIIAKVIYNTIPPKRGFLDFINRQKSLTNKIIIISREEPDLIDFYLKSNQINGVSQIIQDRFNNRSNSNYYSEISKSSGCNACDIQLIDDSLTHCIAAKEAGTFVIGFNDNHFVERQIQMKKVCDLYCNDFMPLL